MPIPKIVHPPGWGIKRKMAVIKNICQQLKIFVDNLTWYDILKQISEAVPKLQSLEQPP
jgi:hypothetical protein